MVGARGWLFEAILELKRAAVAERRMATPAMVKDLDVIEQRAMHLGMVLVAFVMDQFSFPSAEKTGSSAESVGAGIEEKCAFEGKNRILRHP
jgi:hypothetical protein